MEGTVAVMATGGGLGIGVKVPKDSTNGPNGMA